MNIWINGEILSEPKAVINVQEESVRYGYGLFETIRIYHGNPFLLSRHLERMHQSTEILGFTPIYPANVITFAAKKLIHINRVSDGVLRILSTPDHIWITTSPQITYEEKIYEKGIHAMIANTRRNETSPLVRLKTLNYLENILAKREASSLNFGEAVFLNTKGYIAEGSVSNIFLIKNYRLITPDLTQGILPGITRKIVLELAHKNHILTKERAITQEELFDADESFLTNSLMEIMPLVKVDSIQIRNGSPGAVTQLLHQQYKQITSDAVPWEQECPQI
ncbi:MAG: aminotransferase class IV [Dehalobacterium sp.]